MDVGTSREPGVQGVTIRLSISVARMKLEESGLQVFTLTGQSAGNIPSGYTKKLRLVPSYHYLL